MSLIIGIIIAAVSLVFAFQNIETVTIDFITYSFSSSLALVILAALLIGFIIGLFILTPSIFKVNSHIRKLKKENKKLEEQANSSGVVYETEGLGNESVRIGNDEVESNNNDKK